MAELLLNGKKLDDLKVSELKDELDKRDQSKKGNKSALLERLRKVVNLHLLGRVNALIFAGCTSRNGIFSGCSGC